ncbi:MAG: hypothetical protein LBG12_07860 [Synergistaceae bacterium]|jgi:hypothetical protein|nr:hypothetical protein [Synergistaceae bacterium]
MDINIHYARNQLYKALESNCQDADSKDQSEKRIAQWIDVINGIENDTLKIGSRKPAKYPVWVTPEVVRGGFATGRAMADAPFSDEERERLVALAPNAPANRESLFAVMLSDSGLAWLRETLASRRYKIEYPEDSALLVIAWLFENGGANEAMAIVEEIAPYAPTLRFLPKGAAEPVRRTELVHRLSSNEARVKLGEYSSSNINIEVQKEAVSVWIPYMDRLVAHWLALFGGNADEPPRVLPDLPSGWITGAKILAEEYEKLKERRSLCKKYHKPKENLQILLSATRDFLQNGPTAAGLSRAGHVVRCYVKAHGAPGDARHAKTRGEQSRTASMPGYRRIARALFRRLPETDEGIENVDELLGTVSADELSDAETQYAAREIPEIMRKIVRKATAAPLAELIRRGIVPSAEVVASLASQITSMEISRSLADENAALLIAETYKAFFRRRSLLLFDFLSQIRCAELPWVKPLLSEQCGEYGISAALRLAGYSLDFFPGVILPNTLVNQLNELYDMSGRGRPFTSELAADIFMGSFSPAFGNAALTAANLLRGSLYEKYYGLDYGAFMECAADSLRDGMRNRHRKKVLTAIFERALRESRRHGPARTLNYVVDNGMSIELAQIYTTHNLAALVAEGVKLEHSHEELALMACEHSLRLIKKALRPHARNVLRLVKNAAYAWRQSLFFLSLVPHEALDTFFSEAENLSASWLGAEITAQLFTGARIAANGGSPEKEGYRPFWGWVSEHPWFIR